MPTGQRGVQMCGSDPSAGIVRSLLWDNVTIGPRAALDECIVADGVTVAADERFSRCALVVDAAGSRLVQPLD